MTLPFSYPICVSGSYANSSSNNSSKSPSNASVMKRNDALSQFIYSANEPLIGHDAMAPMKSPTRQQLKSLR